VEQRWELEDDGDGLNSVEVWTLDRIANVTHETTTWMDYKILKSLKLTLEKSSK
jgi:hypothetical protein